MKNRAKGLFLWGFAIVLVCIGGIRPAFAQQDSIKTKKNLLINTDSLNRLKAKQDSLRKDSLKKRSSVETTVKYYAKDSIVSLVGDEKVFLYGDAKINYGDIQLEAAEIEMDYRTNLVKARGKIDSTGKLVGVPIFTEKNDKYTAKEITYNTKTKKGLIADIVTKQGEGYIQGEKVKKNENDEMFLNRAKYTTCNLAVPHFHISAKKIKMIPQKAIVTGPFNFRVAGTPTPFSFPFGIFPFNESRRSGIIIPIYGEAQDRGFFLRQGGYYWAVSEGLGLRFNGEIYTNGSWGLGVDGDYKKRYAYQGRMSFYYRNNISGRDTAQQVFRDFWLSWSHTPVTKGSSTFTANVNLGTAGFNIRNSFVPQNQLAATFQSAVTYTKSFAGTPFNLTISMRQDLNTQTGVMSANLPDFSLNMNRIFPFKRKNQPAKNWIGKLNLAYTMTGSNRVTNAFPTAFSLPGATLLNPVATFATVAADGSLIQPPDFFNNFGSLLSRAQFGIQHNIPISTTIKLFKYFSLNPSVNYREIWYTRQLDYSFDSATRPGQTAPSFGVRVDTLNQFSRFYDFNAAVSLTTRIYGTFRIKGSKSIEAIRHTLIPTISASYQPNLSLPDFGFYQRVQIDSAGRQASNPAFANFSRFQGFFLGSPGAQESGAMSFSLSNVLEMKLRPKNDTAKGEKVRILDNLTINGGYNFLAKQFQWQNFNLSARTNILNGLIDINANAVIDPYVSVQSLDASGQPIANSGVRVNRLALSEGKGLGTLTNLNVAISTNLTPKAFKEITKRKVDELNRRREEDLKLGPILNTGLDQYVDFDIPWTLRLNYQISRVQATSFANPVVTQTLGFSGDVSLSKTWKITFFSNYDFQAGRIGMTNLNIIKDLHCWEIRFNWIPFGQLQSYNFVLNVKASILQDLRITRQRSFYDR